MGNRTWLIWLVAFVCAAVVLSAMSVVTLRFVEQSNEDVQQGADAYLEERVRLAICTGYVCAGYLSTPQNRPNPAP